MNQLINKMNNYDTKSTKYLEYYAFIKDLCLIFDGLSPGMKRLSKAIGWYVDGKIDGRCLGRLNNEDYKVYLIINSIIYSEINNDNLALMMKKIVDTILNSLE